MELKLKKYPDGKEFYYLSAGSGKGRYDSLMIWLGKGVSPNVFKKTEEILFPLKDYGIKVTRKNQLVLIRKRGRNLFNVVAKCFLKGMAQFNVIEPSKHKIYRYKIYHSPNVKMGGSEGGLVEILSDLHLKVQVKRK